MKYLLYKYDTYFQLKVYSKKPFKIIVTKKILTIPFGLTELYCIHIFLKFSLLKFNFSLHKHPYNLDSNIIICFLFKIIFVDSTFHYLNIVCSLCCDIISHFIYVLIYLFCFYFTFISFTIFKI